MKIMIGNQVFQGEGRDLARKVVSYRMPKNAKTIAIIGENDLGEQIFTAAVKPDALPFALNEIWDLVQPVPVEEHDCEKCLLKDECPVPELQQLFSGLEEIFDI
ncbi:MAG TPA: hypothetical protein PLG47_00990 [Candidatus Dojkabacteria bacterium]|nr:hypothetical protein [Candidatus Dojkabacteria bacterium]